MSAESWPPAAVDATPKPSTKAPTRSRSAIAGVVGGCLLLVVLAMESIQAIAWRPVRPPPVDGWNPGGLAILIAVLVVGIAAVRGTTLAALAVAVSALPMGAALLRDLLAGTELDGPAAFTAPIAAVLLLASGALCAWSAAAAMLRSRDIHRH